MVVRLRLRLRLHSRGARARDALKQTQIAGTDRYSDRLSLTAFEIVPLGPRDGIDICRSIHLSIYLSIYLNSRPAIHLLTDTYLLAWQAIVPYGKLFCSRHTESSVILKNPTKRSAIAS